MPFRRLLQKWPLKLPLPWLWKRHAAPLRDEHFLRELRPGRLECEVMPAHRLLEKHPLTLPLPWLWGRHAAINGLDSRP